MSQPSKELASWFNSLPPELWLHVIAFADGPTFVNLLTVSHAVRECTLRAMLPMLPIQLATDKAIYSFHSLLTAHPNLANIIHHIWLWPLKHAAIDICILILNQCTRLRSLCCNLTVAQKFMDSPSPWLHTDLTTFTLIRSRNDWHHILIETRNGSAFLEQLTSLGLYHMDWWYNDLSSAPLRNLRHISVDLFGGWWANDIAYAHQYLKDKENFPQLMEVEISCRKKSHFWEPSMLEDGLVLLVVPRPDALGAIHLWAEMVKGRKLVDQAVSRSKMRG